MDERWDQQNFEGRIIEFFSDGVRILGLPKSVGELYGLLFISREPLSLNDMVNRLGMSKGSASQGLKMLRALGAVKEAEGDNLRRSYFEPDVELKRLVGGFIKKEVRPHLASGDEKLGELKSLLGDSAPPEGADFYEERLERLERWSKKARIVLPILQKFLGS
ncbi:transcriptional regulator [bacterium]|nr:transcriptional regulator [bacterium]